MKSGLERIYNGIIKENPVPVLMLGMCPTLAVTTSASNGFGMGVSTMAVLIVPNLIISLQRRVAAVHCSGDCGKSPAQADYVGIDDCRSAVLAGLSPAACAHGCVGLGCGLCAAGCTGCGACAQKCPAQVISGGDVRIEAAVS